MQRSKTGGLPCLYVPPEDDKTDRLVKKILSRRKPAPREPSPTWTSDEDDDLDPLLDNTKWKDFKERELEKLFSVKNAPDSGKPEDPNARDNQDANADAEDCDGDGTDGNDAKSVAEASAVFSHYTNFSDIDTLSMVTTAVSTLTVESEVELAKQYEYRPSNRNTLHVDCYKDQLMAEIEKERVYIITGHTGCGKSSQVPQFILERAFRTKAPVNIIVTQPRRIAAKTLAEHVCRERGWTLGGLVGYHVGLDKMNKSEDTKLLYVTTGVLKMMLIGNHDMANNFTHIIIDEVHERDLDVDFLLTFLKKQMMTTPTSYKLILMSATIAHTKFQSYFAERKGDQFIKAACLDVGNRSTDKTTNNEVNVLYLDRLQVDRTGFLVDDPKLTDAAIKACANILQKLHKKEMLSAVKRERPGAVLIFLPGIREIETIEEAMRRELKGIEGPTLKFVQLHSSLSWEEQQIAFEAVDYGERKVVLATNIAESSITMTDILYVIDFGLTKRLEKDAVTEYPQLQLCWASKQQMKQRKGRVGRVDTGFVFRLVPESFYNEFYEEQLPEMVRVPLSKVVLEIKLSKFGTPSEFLAITMDPPQSEDILGAVKKLKLMGALLPTVGGVDSDLDGDVTVLGEIVARLPVDEQLGKLIVLGHIFGILDEAIIIAAGLNGKSIFSTYYQHKLKSYSSKLLWSDGIMSDFHAILNAYRAWLANTCRGETAISNFPQRARQFCLTYNLSQKQLIEMKQLIQEIQMNLKNMHIETPINQPQSKYDLDKDLMLQIALFGAFYPNYFFKFYNPEREKEAYRTLMKEDPMRSVYFTGLPGDHYKIGLLYRSQVISFIQEFTSPDVIEDIIFTTNKIIVVFKKDIGSETKGDNQVPVAALLALKNKSLWNKSLGNQSLGKKLEVRLYNEEKAKQRLERSQQGQEEDEESPSRIKIPQLSPPSLEMKEVTFLIMQVDSPQSFWVVYEDTFPMLQQNTNIINKNLEKCKVAQRNEIEIGGIYLAPFDDGTFYRASVTSLNPIKLFFFDYGNSKVCENDIELRLIPTELQKELCGPALAVQCSLMGIHPHIQRTTKNIWDEELIQKMNEMLEGKCNLERYCKGTIYADVSASSGFNKYMVKLSAVHLFLHSGVQVELRSWLLDQHLATAVAEKHTVQEEAKKRSQFEDLSDAMKEHLNDKNRYRTTDIEVKESFDDLKISSAILKGPFHAMQTSVTGCCQRNSSLTKIDPNSVNCVLLDWNPGEEQDHWMFAAHVAKSTFNGDLLVRNTGWLPAKPGLGPLAIMMFSPRVQMRANEGKTHFIGYLGGLGWKEKPVCVDGKKKWKPNFAQYDMEISFDARVGLDEIIAVDEIRSALSKVLSRGPHQVLRVNQMELVFECREMIKKNLALIIDKNFSYKAKELNCATSEYSWFGDLPKSDTQSLFSAIQAPKLRKIDDLIEELKELKGPSEEKFTTDVYCPVCSEQLLCPADVNKHLKRPHHIAALARVKKLFS